MKNLVYLLLIVPIFAIGQRKLHLDRPAPMGHLAAMLLDLSIQQESNSVPVEPSDLYDDQSGGDAASISDGSSLSIKWTDGLSPSNLTIIDSTYTGEGNIIKVTVNGTGSARLQFPIDLIGTGFGYDYTIRALASASSKFRIIDPRIVGGDYAGISSQPFITTAWATYNLELSPPTTGTYNLWIDVNGEEDGLVLYLALLKVEPKTTP